MSETLLRRCYRRLYWAPHDLRHWRALGRIRHLVYLGGGGIGDSLNCSTVVHELNRRSPGRVSLMTPYPELFAAHPTLRSLHAYDATLLAALARRRRPVVHPAYAIPRGPPPPPRAPSGHLAAQLCRSCGVTGRIALRPYFYFQPGEKERFASYRDAVTVQASCLNAHHVLPAKNWPPERMQAVVSGLRGRYRLVQTGHRDDPLLAGVEDLRGRLSLRECAALLAQSRFFLGLVGFLMHLARAVDTRSVIVYGGREHPWQSGYGANENLVGLTPCAPCGLDDPCPVGHLCMTQITPEHVGAAVRRLEARLTLPLETDELDLPAAAPTAA